ncbi:MULTISPECIES: LysR family transcriptional regulator [Phyllobacteriaceae]|jgi:DNA-binding transcriptional LysR family regulator|uniref:LysR family transcriptional regulator n=1 Tax=Mesorhizobium hungaricum TaxID=1566387 RepID=A0A1C2E0W1_9HYPH|nr:MULTISPECIES: LysR family transcriptional regulator [Mesorhizobium]MBN9235521.1 LysR family transcriptional regulator [Mesorhizobium sp.]MDQ0331325.1 DNA-binding transcriptional LysR family regulator [Mesorhizobium sp. YL-MeA3-2017]OCX20664.1 LysR family transcriptional regulator [Mesorhizobium hungaricum]
MELLHNGLKLRQLQVFREVLRAGSTRRAAAALGVSQPAISQHVKQLEATLGIALFERSTNRIQPLPTAWELLRNVELALNSLERLEASIFAMKNDGRQRIAIATPAVFGFVTLPKVVAIIRAKTSSNVRTISGTYDQIGEHILAGRADLGISRLPVDPRLFDWAPLGSARNVCVFHPGHRFSRQERVETNDLAGETIVDIDPRFASHQMNMNALRFEGIEPDILVEYDSSGHEAGFVSAGLGVSISNEILAREYAAFGLQARPVEPSALYHYVAIWQKGRVFPDALKISLEAILSTFAASACGD